MESPDYPIFIDPPTSLRQHVPRMEMREALRLAKKIGRVKRNADAYLYTADETFYLEAGHSRRGFPSVGNWDGCVSLRADILLPFWNSLPHCEPLEVRYDSGWLYFGTLAIGRAVWQPKYDPEWMIK